MLKFFHGTQLEQLGERLLEEIDGSSHKNILKTEIFVVQNHGIGQWLSLYMAERQGIAANLKFEFPSERIWSLIRQIDDDIPQNLPSDRQPMTWSLMRLLQDEQVLADFDELRRYVQDDDPTQRAVRTWKLSSKIADVFDQYLVYRPGLLLDWEAGNLPHNREAERWQAALWNRLVERWDQHSDHPKEWLHRARLQQKLLASIEQGTLDCEELPGRISIFGVSDMSPVFVETMVSLSKLTDVHFYQLTVHSEVKQSNDFNNPLLQSLGTQGAEVMGQLAQCVKRDAHVKNNLEWESVSTESTEQKSAFRGVQKDIKQDNAPTGRNLKVPAFDASIQVHSCHSAMREVEVLYDQLLAVLDENPEMSPDDILVMTPDIETYAPMIEAVFETPDEGQPAIPYSIADRGIQGANPAIESFLTILELCESRFKVTDVLDLLDANPIQEAFGFSDDDLNRLEQWIRDNRIRWGIDAPFKRSMDVPEKNSYTWRAGVDRMLLGYAMKPGDDRLHRGIFPYDEVETSEDASLAGKFSHFLRALFDFSRNIRNNKTPEKWVQVITQIPDTFLPDNRDYFRDLSQIRDALDRLKETASLGDFDRELPFRIIRSWLQDQLEEQSTGGGRIGQGVTFSSLKPMRSIPFQFIGMIGMNDGAFPRSKIPIEFDLMNLEPQPGDPVQAEQERFLFLENLLSARSHIYFSYTGQSNRQDADFPPSVVLKEFLDYLQEHYGLKSDGIIQKHRLQAFSPKYFGDSPLFSYSETQQKISRQLKNGQSASSLFVSQPLPEPEEEWKKLSLQNLVSFFQHPAKYLLHNRLGIYLREDDVLTEDREPFALNGLDDYQVGQELLDHFMKGQSLDSYRRILESRDMLPEGWSGRQAYREKAREVRDFGSEIAAVFDQPELEDCEVDLDIGDYRIVGKLSDIYERALMRYRFGRMRAKDVIDLWIRHLLFQQVKPAGHPGYSCLFTRDKDTPFAVYQLSPVEKSETILEDLLDFYWQGLQRCIYFFPKTSFAYGEAVCRKGKDPRGGLSKAAYQWDRSYGSYPGEVGDPYNKLLMGSRNPLEVEKFQTVAVQFWTPFFAVLNQERD